MHFGTQLKATWALGGFTALQDCGRRVVNNSRNFVSIGKPNTGRLWRCRHVSGGPIQAEGLLCFVLGTPIQMKESGRE